MRVPFHGPPSNSRTDIHRLAEGAGRKLVRLGGRFYHRVSTGGTNGVVEPSTAGRKQLKRDGLWHRAGSECTGSRERTALAIGIGLRFGWV